MEIFGGFVVMMSFISLFLAVVWLIMPFVVFAIKGKQDRTLEILESIEKRLAALEDRMKPVEPEQNKTDPAGPRTAPAESTIESSHEHPIENAVTLTESAAEKKDSEASSAE